MDDRGRFYRREEVGDGKICVEGTQGSSMDLCKWIGRRIDRFRDCNFFECWIDGDEDNC